MPKSFIKDRDLIQKDTFVEVVNDLHDDDLSKGDYLYVINMQAFPVSKEDPYTQRLHIIGHKHLNKGELDTTRVLIIDPSNLKCISKVKNKTMMRRFKAWYSKVSDKVN